MSISGALSNALTGLTAASRGAEVVSSNLANALTEGYGKRELQLAPRTVGGQGAGVRITGVARIVDPVLLSSRRLADAETGRAGVAAGFFARIEQTIGLPDTAGSLSDRVAALEAALASAASRPDSDARLQTVVDSLGSLVDKVGDISDTIQGERMEADRGIARQVDEVNAALKEIARLNDAIRSTYGLTQDSSGLVDERQRLIDRVSSIIPVREVPRSGGAVALYATGGAILLDGTAQELGFTPVGIITPDMTLASNALSGLTLDGRPVVAQADSGVLGGGTLGALFTLRDSEAVQAQARLDAFARDLMERFESATADPTLTPGNPGLLTDLGTPFNATLEVGLADRLRVNALADPAQGGQLWRVRDGLGAAAAGDTGQSAILQSLGAALSLSRTSASGGLLPGSRTAAQFAGEVLSSVGQARQVADTRAAASTARSTALKEAELAGGVDSDQELQRLLLIENAYAANARVVQTLDDMLDMLSRI